VVTPTTHPGALAPRTCVVTIAIYAALQVGQVSLRDAATLARVPYRTFARWVAAWLARGVDGIHVETARARAGRRYVVDRSVVERWLACELPTPYAR